MTTTTVHHARALTNAEFARLLEASVRRIVRMLTRAGALVADPEEEGPSPYLNLERPEDALAVLGEHFHRLSHPSVASRKCMSKGVELWQGWMSLTYCKLVKSVIWRIRSSPAGASATRRRSPLGALGSMSCQCLLFRQPSAR